MRAGIIVTGVLGAGTVLVFAVAGLVATLFPSGTLINSGWNGCFDCGGGWGKPGIAVPMPVPLPIMEPVPEKGIILPGRGVVVDLAPAGPASTANDVIAQP